MKYIFNPFTQMIEVIPNIDWEKVKDSIHNEYGDDILNRKMWFRIQELVELSLKDNL